MVIWQSDLTVLFSYQINAGASPVNSRHGGRSQVKPSQHPKGLSWSKAFTQWSAHAAKSVRDKSRIKNISAEPVNRSQWAMTIKDLNQSCCKMLLVFLISTTLMLTSHAQVFQDEGLVKIITITLLFGLTLEISREQQLTLFHHPPYFHLSSPSYSTFHLIPCFRNHLGEPANLIPSYSTLAAHLISIILSSSKPTLYWLNKYQW